VWHIGATSLSLYLISYFFGFSKFVFSCESLEAYRKIKTFVWLLLVVASKITKIKIIKRIGEKRGALQRTLWRTL
jgi:hypothetical protein